MTDNAMMRRSSIAAKDILILKKTKKTKTFQSENLLLNILIPLTALLKSLIYKLRFPPFDFINYFYQSKSVKSPLYP